MAGFFSSKFTFSTTSTSGASANGIGGIIFAAIWISFSSVFVAIGGTFAWKTLTQVTWPQVPCVIDDFQILDDPKQDKPFIAKVTFHYEVDGHPYTGHALYPNEPTTAKSTRQAEAEPPADTSPTATRESDYQKLASLQHQYLSHRSSVCRVDPRDPNHAALRIKHDGLWGGLAFGGFGLCFVGVGVGILVQSIRQMRGKRAGAAVTANPQQGDRIPLLIGLPFFGLFAAAGCGMFCFISVPMVKNLLAGPSWVETPAKVIWSRVATHHDSDGNTHKADVFYQYTYDGKEYRSNTSSLFEASSSGLSGKQEEVRAHPPGKTFVCYVNTDRPWEAVRNRSCGWSGLFGFFPLPFMAVGLGGLWFLLRRKNLQATGGGLTRQAKRISANRFVQSPDAGFPRGTMADTTTGELHLTPGKGRIARFLGMVFVATFWNGIVSVFLWQVASEWRHGQAPWFLSLFLTPFVCIGLVLLAAALNALGAIFNPRPRVSLDPGSPRLGQPLTVAWLIPSGARRLENLRIVLRGEEVATYRRGTNTATDRALFHEAVIADATTFDMMTTGRATVTLPGNLMPSWKSNNNRIEWTLHVEGRIRHWPDLADSHGLTILPAD